MLNLLPWLLAGSNRHEYALKQQGNEPTSYSIQLYAICLLCIVWTRILFNFLCSKSADRIAKARGHDLHHKDGKKLLEELWVFLGNLCTMSISIWIMLNRNGHCTFTSTKPCLENWPNHDINQSAVFYYSLELAWYSHLILKKTLGYGVADGRDMISHHGISIALLLFSWSFNLTRCGIMILTLFSLSNPALHFAKICNQLNISFLRIPAFAAFSFIFFVSRVVLVPWLILYTTMMKSKEWIPYAVEDFYSFYIMVNALLLVLYGMQWVWMLSIVHVLREAMIVGGHAASALSAKVDPAKRYSSSSSITTTATTENGVDVRNGTSNDDDDDLIVSINGSGNKCMKKNA